MNGRSLRDLRQLLTWIFTATLVLSLLSAGYLAFTFDDQGEPYTEFYLLNSEGEASNYPDELRVGETGEVIIGITNQEHEHKTYSIVVIFEERIIESETIRLDNGQHWEQTITFTPESIGEKQLEIRLYTGDEDHQSDDPYDTLRLQVEVLNPVIELNKSE